MAKKMNEMVSSLSGYNTLGIRANIVMKDKKIKPFIALVKWSELGFENPNPKVIFGRFEGTIDFPVDGDEYETFIKNVLSADYIVEDFIRKMNE
jgi:hypothetical protein